jgi:hypothetical protein
MHQIRNPRNTEAGLLHRWLFTYVLYASFAYNIHKLLFVKAEIMYNVMHIHHY